MQVATQFESLPNEIFIECFEYLNAIDIFNAFDYLNCRFDNLIRHIPLHLDVGKVEESRVVQSGIKILLNLQVKTQIRSLTLAEGKIFDNIQTLLSFVSLNECSQLQALILSVHYSTQTNQISSMLPKMLHIERTFDPHNFLNDSIKHVSQKYKSIETTIPIDDMIDKATRFLQTSTTVSSVNDTDMVEQWKASLLSDVANLAGNCMAETHFTSWSIYDLAMIGTYVSVNTPELMIYYPNTETDVKDTIKWKIFQEISDEINRINSFSTSFTSFQ